MICFSKNHNDKNYGGLTKLLDILLSDKIKADKKKEILENEYNIKMTKSIERKVLGMCNISDGVYERGIERGMIVGAIKMCKELEVSLMDTVKRISSKFDLSEQEVEKEVRKYWE